MPATPPPKSGPLPKLLPIRLQGGFVVEHLSDDCSQCKEEIDMQHWTAEVSWLGPSALVIQMHATCPACQAPKSVHARFRGKPDGTAEVDCETGDGQGWTAHQAFTPSRWRAMLWSVKQVFGRRN